MPSVVGDAVSADALKTGVSPVVGLMPSKRAIIETSARKTMPSGAFQFVASTPRTIAPMRSDPPVTVVTDGKTYGGLSAFAVRCASGASGARPP